MKKKHILIIGAGKGQVPLITKAKEMGYFVTAVSPYDTDPGVKIADNVFVCDIFQKDAIVKFAKENHVDGVLTDMSDICTPIAAYVAEQLGLPGYGYESALCFTDKTKMREVFERIGLPVVKNEKTVTLDQAVKAATKIGYPVVIKPADSFSSRGVYIVYNSKELRQHYQESLDLSQSKVVIVEQCIVGPQYFSQGYVEKGKLRLFAFSDRYYYDIPDICVPYTNAFPAMIDQELKDKMESEFSKVIEYLKPDFGQVWAEWIYDDTEHELYIVEMAIRGAGAEVTTRVIPFAYGVDSEFDLIADAMGDKKESFFDRQFSNRAAAFYSFLLPEGVLESVDGLDDLLSIEGVEYVDLKEMHVGDQIEKYKDKTSRYGLIVIQGETRGDLDKIWETLKNRINIQVRTKDGLKGAIWE